MPKLLLIFKSTVFLQRVSILLAVELLAGKLSNESNRMILNNVVALSMDPVENVRMGVCVALGALYNYQPKEKELIKKTLKNLQEDKDIDVREIATNVFSKLE